MSTTDLATRYGSRRPWRHRAVVGAATVVVLAFTGWLAWVIWEQSRPAVASGNLVYDDQSATDRSITARFDVDMDPDVDEASCTLEAYGKSGTVRVLVGRLTFAVPPGTTRVEQAIATDRRASSVELVGCTAPGQDRPR